MQTDVKMKMRHLKSILSINDNIGWYMEDIQKVRRQERDPCKINEIIYLLCSSTRGGWSKK